MLMTTEFWKELIHGLDMIQKKNLSRAFYGHMKGRDPERWIQLIWAKCENNIAIN